MKKIKKINKIVILTILVLICIAIKSIAQDFPEPITYKHNINDIFGPFPKGFEDGKLTFCRQHGHPIWSLKTNIMFTIDEKAGIKTMKDNLAKVFDDLKENYLNQQMVVWYLSGGNVKELNAMKDSGDNYPQLNTGKTLAEKKGEFDQTEKEEKKEYKNIEDTKNVLKQNMNYKNPEYKGIYFEEENTEIIQVKKKTVTEKNGLEETSTSAEEFKKVSLYIKGEVNNLGDLETIPVSIEVKNEKNEKIDIYGFYNDNKDCVKFYGKTRDEQISLKDFGKINIYIKKDAAKTITINVSYNYNVYTGQYAEYTYNNKLQKEKGYKELSEGNVQNVLRLKTNKESKTETETITVKLNQPRLITTKYIKKIVNADGNIVFEAAESWDRVNWRTPNEKPIVEVDETKAVNSSERYKLTPQDLTKVVNISKGDKITYNIRIYNVGDEADPLDINSIATNIRVNPSNPEETNYDANWGYILHGGYLLDVPSDYWANSGGTINNYLEYVEEGYGWIHNENYNYYHMTLDTVIGLIKKNGIGAFTENGKIGEWSEYVPITFRVKGNAPGEYALAQNKDIINNDSKVHENDSAHIKFLYSIDFNGDGKADYEPRRENQPDVQVDTSLAVGDPNRFKCVNMNAEDITLMDGYTVTYCFRYYSIATNKTKITYKVEDIFGEGLVYQSAICEDKPINVEQNGNVITIDPPGFVIDGYIDGSEVPYKDVYITFKVDLKNSTTPKQTSYIQNNNTQFPTGYEIEGRVYIDQFKEGKTNSRNALYDLDTDTPAKGVKVELLNADGTPAVVEDATGRYPTIVYTDENGYYKFTHLRSRKIYVLSESGVITGNINDSTPYRIRFTYNGQVYENVRYNIKYNSNTNKNATNCEGAYSYNGSFATEEDRTGFNNKFKTIDGSNSSSYTLKPDENKKVEQGKGPDSDYDISSYTGSNGWNSSDGTLTVDSINKEDKVQNVNLGLVQRHFDLTITNKLKSMDIQINGVKQTLNSTSGKSISAILNKSDYKYSIQELYLKESDYKWDAEDNNKELEIWANYEIEIKNESKDAFAGIINELNFYYDSNFEDRIKVIYNSDNYEDTNNVNTPNTKINKDSNYNNNIKKAIINMKSKKVKSGESCKIIVRVQLKREEIEKIIEENAENTENYENTLDTCVEISSYGSKYEKDIYNNGHGIRKPNAGKIDEDSNAGDFSIRTENRIS